MTLMGYFHAGFYLDDYSSKIYINAEYVDNGVCERVGYSKFFLISMYMN